VYFPYGHSGNPAVSDPTLFDRPRIGR
jgi:hypothetical protein